MKRIEEPYPKRVEQQYGEIALNAFVVVVTRCSVCAVYCVAVPVRNKRVSGAQTFNNYHLFGKSSVAGC